ncbi:MAG: hypothetical protein QOC78_149 [Solirubrobacteraceae bacterium]|jgi:hypothetical protein|nr:hypothetical protein [Solirubrobacteraceae bacterium]
MRLMSPGTPASLSCSLFPDRAPLMRSASWAEPADRSRRRAPGPPTRWRRFAAFGIEGERSRRRRGRSSSCERARRKCHLPGDIFAARLAPGVVRDGRRPKRHDSAQRLRSLRPSTLTTPRRARRSATEDTRSVTTLRDSASPRCPASRSAARDRGERTSERPWSRHLSPPVGGGWPAPGNDRWSRPANAPRHHPPWASMAEHLRPSTERPGHRPEQTLRRDVHRRRRPVARAASAARTPRRRAAPPAADWVGPGARPTDTERSVRRMGRPGPTRPPTLTELPRPQPQPQPRASPRPPGAPRRA